MKLLTAAAAFGLVRLLAATPSPPMVEDPARDAELVEAGVATVEEDAPTTADLASIAQEGLAGVDAAELFVEANRWYDAGEYGKAVVAYSTLIARGVAGPAVHYNLGNALLRDGRLGAAIAAYRRAKVLSPRDADLDANLRFARASARDALEPPAPGAVRRTLFFWHYSLSASETLRLAVLANLVLFAALSLRLSRRGSEPLRWVAVIAGVVLLALVGSLVCRWALPLRVAVILPAEVEAFSGTGADTVVRFRLHAGTEVRAVETSGDWVRIALPNGEQGWVGSDQVELITALR
ncbi:MAG TPA: tetratricopeptide repeat protein [Thermoanaerobaculia bacterium]|nr:tetratricopeptide repeat protein [Thermoanaerobaculia bacterium]